MYSAETPEGQFEVAVAAETQAGSTDRGEDVDGEGIEDPADSNFAWIQSKKQRSTVNDAERQRAAHSIRPGCDQHMLSTWKPASHKPMLKHLHNALIARNITPAKSWDNQKCATVLYNTEPLPPPPPDSLSSEAASVISPESVQAPAVQDAVVVAEVIGEATQDSQASNLAPPPAPRWYAIRQGCRLVHTILDMKDEFLQRDIGHQSRLEKEAAARNSFWVRAAARFNDSTFLPTLIKTNDMSTNIVFETNNLDPSSTKYKGVSPSLLSRWACPLC